MGDNRSADYEALQQLAAAVNEAGLPVASRPRPLSALRDAFDATGGDALSAAELIERMRARRTGSPEGTDEAPGNRPGASGT